MILEWTAPLRFAHPAPALKRRSSLEFSSMQLPDETIYGHTKKLRFIIAVLRREALRLGRLPNVIDFGCGNGSAVSQYLIPHSDRFVGIDIHPASLDYARSNFSTPRATFARDLPAWGFPADVIVYADVLEHLTDPVTILRHYFNNLIADGIVVGSVPNGYGLYEIESSVGRRFGLFRLMGLSARLKRHLVGRAPPISDLPYNQESGHVQFFTRRALFELHAAAGFLIELFHPGVFAGAPISERLIRNNKWIIAANASFAEKLPWWAVSTWLFTARRPMVASGNPDRPFAEDAASAGTVGAGLSARS
jgi:SAM-dependent methyltransferase